MIDTHVHLTMPQYTDVPAVLARAQAVGVTKFIAPGLDLASSEAAIALHQQYSEIIPAIGLHPLNQPEPLEAFRALAHNPAVKAIGEIGTDRNGGDWSAQEERLRFFLELALETGKPALLHIRETWSETFAILRDYPQLRDKAVIHCFTGRRAEAAVISDLGLFVSVTAIVARSGMEATLEVLREWPLERMMLETDGPYLPWPGEKMPNEPATVAKVAQFLAELKGISPEEVAEKTTQTAQQFFNL